MKNKRQYNMERLPMEKRKRSQIFSLDVMVAIFVLISVLMSAIWVWDTSREKIYLSEKRNDMELRGRNAIYGLLQTVGDPPYWDQIDHFNTTNIYALGIGKNRPWYIDIDKLNRLVELNDTNYTNIKTMLTIRGYEFFMNISRYDINDSRFYSLGNIGKYPNGSAEQVVRVDRFALTNSSWVKVTMYVWNECDGPYC